MRYIDYRERLGIGFNDKGKEQLFVNRMRLVFQQYLGFSPAHRSRFCYAVGLPMEVVPSYYGGEEAWKYLSKFHSFKEFLAALVFFVNTYDSFQEKQEKQDVTSMIKQALTDSGIPFDVVEDTDGIFIFPKGAKELDDNLVSEPLQWLTQYPNARDAWIKALKVYADATDNNASDCADLFRKALEQFFKEFFSSDKSLENYKSEYGALMKSRGIPAELSNMFEKVLTQYTAYMNNYAKHKDGTAKIALEYIMYQTGSLIRFLITLKQEEINHAD